jgi:hypothetical protein
MDVGNSETRASSSPSHPIDAGGFAPGTVLADRYRIVALVGRGGMGEVYRADDLRLGQPVALKFLPPTLERDLAARDRLLAEVRSARTVSHPNVCRVYDVGDVDGRVFLTMEYIDGEDLASLLRRIGRLPAAKALEIARQLCAGLGAAHDKGVLHRDLKPANVMIDGRGHARITDFGLAVAASDALAAGDVAGTPAYMAPEQLAGKGASVQSDIYALGLVLYELYTGRRAFDAPSLAELRAKKERATLSAPSGLAKDIDPIVERVILGCIDKDPRQRPASVVRVAAALPGGDPLAAALAAGETPSPEMVAASGSKEGLRPAIAWACLAFTILGVAAPLVIGRPAQLFRRVALEQPRDVMVKTARDILSQAGYTAPPVDSAFGFEADKRYLNLGHVDRISKRWDDPPAFAIRFWYRQSPGFLERWSSGVNPSSFVPGGVDYTDPPVMLPGEAVVWLDSRGRLIGLRAVPREESRPPNGSPVPEWAALFEAAGIDPSKCTPVELERAFPVSADARAAWTGVLPDRPDVPIRIEAAAYHGKPVSWRMFVPSWNPATIGSAAADICGSTRTTPSLPDPGGQAGNIVTVFIVFSVIAGAAFFARRNLRAGRGDRRGASRLAWFAFGGMVIAWVFSEHHAPTAREVDRFSHAAALALYRAGMLWLAYVAVEPYVRRRWPDLLIGWSRLLTRGARDPLVGRDLLVGCVAGVAWVLLNFLSHPVAGWLGVPTDPQAGVFLGTTYLFSGAHAVAAGVSGMLLTAVFYAFVMLFLLVLLRVLLRNTVVAAIAFVLILTAQYGLGIDQPFFYWPLFALMFTIFAFVLIRFGVIAFAAALVFGAMLLGLPITTDVSAWYFGTGLTGLLAVLALALYAFHTALGGRPMFGHATLDD